MKVVFSPDIGQDLIIFRVPLLIGSPVWISLTALSGQSMDIEEAAQRVCKALQPVRSKQELFRKVVTALFDSCTYCDEMRRRIDANMG